MATRYNSSRLVNKDYSFKQSVSMIVATYNEITTIGNRLENLIKLNYPKKMYEIIVVDSGSTDNTRDIVHNVIRNLNANDPSIRLITEEQRNGKSSALNLGIKYSRGDIILVVDANSTYDENILYEIIPHFKDNSIGAVSGRYNVQNQDSKIPQAEAFYWQIENATFKGESSLDSISTVIGGISAWRKNLVTFSTQAISEDLDMTMTLRKKGYKIKYEPYAVVYEPAAGTVEDQILQRKRTCLGTIQCMVKHWRDILTPKNMYFNFIFPSHKIIPMFSPFIFILLTITYLLVEKNAVIIAHLLVCVGLSFICYLLLVKYISDDSSRAKPMSLDSIINIGKYVLLNEYIILLAWYNYVFSNYSVLWEKPQSTRITELGSVLNE